MAEYSRLRQSRSWSLIAKLVETGRRVQGITGVSRNSTPLFKLELLRDRAIVVLGRVYKSLLRLI